jgi:ElaB/YqjD/DUF883 family membrane-anchored ribosome-binding protein
MTERRKAETGPSGIKGKQEANPASDRAAGRLPAVSRETLKRYGIDVDAMCSAAIAQAEKRPLRTVGLAAAVGFVAGWLSSR